MGHPFGTSKMRTGATHFLMKTLKRVRTEMAALPEDHRIAIMLVCVEGLSYQQAAAELGIPTIMAGNVANSDSRIHSPNESVRLDDYFEAVAYFANLFRRIAA